MNAINLILNAAAKEVEFPVKLIDIHPDPDKPEDVKDYAVISSQTKAILFRSFYNQLPVISLALSFAYWMDERGHTEPF